MKLATSVKVNVVTVEVSEMVLIEPSVITDVAVKDVAVAGTTLVLVEVAVEVIVGILR